MKKYENVKRGFMLILSLFVASQMTIMAQSITNPSFEDGTNGWTVNKMQLQGNDGMSGYKAGNTYIERWIAAPGLLGCASVKQTVTGLTNGVYRLTVAAMNLSQNNENAAQVGAWIVGNGLRTAVTTRNNYTLDFFVTDGTAEIGFVCEGASGNWVGCDNFQLSYVGNSTNNIKSAGNTVKNYASNLINTYGSNSQYSNLVSTLNSAINGGNLNNVANAAKAVVAGERAYRLRHPSGSAPTVTTRPRHARGSVWIFGRLEWSGNDVVEEGFCWSTSPNPTAADNYTTDWIDSYGKVIWMQNLTPGTMYYVRAYAMTRGGAVGYGDVIKVPTLPQGHINWWVRTDDDASNVLRASCQRAFDYYWNNLTQLTTFGPNIGHVSGVPTAECGYGGWMSVGDSWSYQQPGTLMHEALHGVGVGQHWMWGDFVRDQFPVWDAIRFWNNNEWEGLSGDGMHMWPYGINGAHEDNGSDQLYIGNALVCEALGEAGLPLTDAQWLLPYYAFPQDDNTKYYLKCEDENRGLSTSYLVVNNSGNLEWKEMSASQALSDNKAAWYITFDASIQKYHFRNASTNQYIRYSGNIDAINGFTTGNSATDIQMKKCRVNVTVGTETYNGYYLLDYASGQAMEAKENRAVGSIGFRIWDDGSLQRWLILSANELAVFDAAAVEIRKDELRNYLNGYKACKNVAHTDKAWGATTMLNNTITTIEAAISGTVTLEQVNQYISDIKSAGATFLNNTKPTNNNAYDLTFLLVNPNFTDGTEGWSGNPALGFGAIEFYQTTFDLYQVLPDMPSGNYQLTATSFQRPGENAAVYNAYQGGNNNVSAVLYLNNTNLSQKIKNVMSEQQGSSISNGEYQTPGNTYVPNGMESGSAYFELGKYVSSVQGEVEAGDLRIGLRGDVSNSFYWTMADNFKLYFYGNDNVVPTIKNDLMASGFTRITALPNDYSPYFFVLYDYGQDLTLVEKSPVNQGGSKSVWYDGDVNPMTSKTPLWTMDSFTQDGIVYQVLANANEPDFMLQTEWNAPWNYRCSDNGGGNTYWGRTKYTYLSDGYWTIQNGVYPDAGYLGPWNNVVTDDAETALNKQGDAVGHFDIFTILRGDWVKRFDSGINAAAYNNPYDITYVLENPGGERRTTMGWKSNGSNWQAQGNSPEGKIGSYYLEAYKGGGVGNADLYQEISGLPNGFYRFSAVALIRGGASGFSLYANNNRTAVTNIGDNLNTRFEVMVEVTDGNLRVGAKAESVTADWIAFDAARLEYLGTTLPGTVGTPTSNIANNPLFQSLDTWTLEFTEADNQGSGAVFAQQSNNAKVSLYKGNTKVGDFPFTISGKTVSTTFAGLTLEGGVDYRLELPAGSVGYYSIVANEAVSTTFHTPAIFDGTYYLYNTDNQKYLSRGGEWATACILDDWGLAFQVHTDANGTTTLKYFDSQAYLYNDGWCWADGGAGINFTVTKTGSTYKFLNQNNNRYLAVYGGRAVGDAQEGGNLVGTSNVWTIETPAEHAANYTRTADAQAAAAASAAGYNGITTAAQLDDWSGSYVNITGARAERYQWYAATAQTLAESEYYKETVWNLPTGLYRLSCDAFQRAAWFDDVRDADGARGSIYLYANDAKTQIKSVMEYASTTAYTGEAWADYETGGLHYPNSENAGYTALNTGNYQNVVYVYVNNGTLTFGINNPNRLGNNLYRGTWAVFQNFRLERVTGNGIKSRFDDDFDEATGIETMESQIDLDNAEVYDLSGRRVSRPSKGFFIVNGKKIFIK